MKVSQFRYRAKIVCRWLGCSLAEMFTVQTPIPAVHLHADSRPSPCSWITCILANPLFIPLDWSLRQRTQYWVQSRQSELRPTHPQPWQRYVLPQRKALQGDVLSQQGRGVWELHFDVGGVLPDWTWKRPGISREQMWSDSPGWLRSVVLAESGS